MKPQTRGDALVDKLTEGALMTGLFLLRVIGITISRITDEEREKLLADSKPLF